MEFRQFLTSLPAFEDLHDAELESLIAGFHVEQHIARHVFFEQGQAAGAMYLLLDGSVNVTRNDDLGQPIEAGDLGEGEVFGLLALVGVIPATSTAVANTVVTVGRLDFGDYASLFMSAPTAARRLQRMVAVQLARELQFRNRLLRARMRKDLSRA